MADSWPSPPCPFFTLFSLLALCLTAASSTCLPCACIPIHSTIPVHLQAALDRSVSRSLATPPSRPRPPPPACDRSHSCLPMASKADGSEAPGSAGSPQSVASAGSTLERYVQRFRDAPPTRCGSAAKGRRGGTGVGRGRRCGSQKLYSQRVKGKGRRRKEKKRRRERKKGLSSSLSLSSAAVLCGYTHALQPSRHNLHLRSSARLTASEQLQWQTGTAKRLKQTTVTLPSPPLLTLRLGVRPHSLSTVARGGGRPRTRTFGGSRRPLGGPWTPRAATAF